jgi:hypothetical protein
LRQKIYGFTSNLDPLTSNQGPWMIKVDCCGFPVKRGTYYLAYMMFNNVSM